MALPKSFEKIVPTSLLVDFAAQGRIALSGEIIAIEQGGRQLTFSELEEPLGTKIVGMNEEGHLKVPAGEAARIATFGLGGCTAIGVVATFRDGIRRAHVQHYDPFRKRMDDRETSLEEMILDREARGGGYRDAIRVDAVVMIPGLGYRIPDDPAHLQWLTETITSEFGEQTNVHPAIYSMGEVNGESPYVRSLVIDIPAEGSPRLLPGFAIIETS